jgi:hypothetical protein
MEWIITNGDDLLAIIGGVVTVASIIVKLTPSTSDDEILGKVVSVLERFSVFNKK